MGKAIKNVCYIIKRNITRESFYVFYYIISTPYLHCSVTEHCGALYVHRNSFPCAAVYHYALYKTPMFCRTPLSPCCIYFSFLPQNRSKPQSEGIYTPLNHPVTVPKIALTPRKKMYEPFFQELLLSGPDISKCKTGCALDVDIGERTLRTRIASVEDVHWQDITHGMAKSVMGDRAKRADLMKEVMITYRKAFGRKSPLFCLVTFEVV